MRHFQDEYLFPARLGFAFVTCKDSFFIMVRPLINLFLPFRAWSFSIPTERNFHTFHVTYTVTANFLSVWQTAESPVFSLALSTCTLSLCFLCVYTSSLSLEICNSGLISSFMTILNLLNFILNHSIFWMF